MTSHDLADLVSAISRFQRDSTNLAAVIGPLLRRGSSANPDHRSGDLPAAVTGVLHRIDVVLRDAVAVVGDSLAEIARISEHA